MTRVNTPTVEPCQEACPHKAYIFCHIKGVMDYSYRLPRLFKDVDELWEHQKKLERYINYLLEKKATNLGKLEKKIADQERQIEKLKERTELMAKDNMRLKEHVNRLTEVVEHIMNKQKRDERLEQEREGTPPF
jgi:septal ring factor EnvC (AmiA/AmiB activator)